MKLIQKYKLACQKDESVKKDYRLFTAVCILSGLIGFYLADKQIAPELYAVTDESTLKAIITTVNVMFVVAIFGIGMMVGKYMSVVKYELKFGNIQKE